MASVYILVSGKFGKYYVGSCLDLNERISDPKNRIYRNSFTSAAEDWELYFEISNLEGDVARKIESDIKLMKSKKYIENLKKYPEMSMKLLESFE